MQCASSNMQRQLTIHSDYQKVVCIHFISSCQLRDPLADNVSVFNFSKGRTRTMSARVKFIYFFLEAESIRV